MDLSYPTMNVYEPFLLIYIEAIIEASLYMLLLCNADVS